MTLHSASVSPDDDDDDDDGGGGEGDGDVMMMMMMMELVSEKLDSIIHLNWLSAQDEFTVFCRHDNSRHI
jgi:hypothetical protein